MYCKNFEQSILPWSRRFGKPQSGLKLSPPKRETESAPALAERAALRLRIALLGADRDDSAAPK
jgi:hypothetical protein